MLYAAMRIGNNCEYFLFQSYLIYPGTWFKLIIDIILFAIVYWGALYVFGMNSEEKNLIMTPFRRFLRFCK